MSDGRCPPHAGVYVRVKPSHIHGVGLFAIRDIPEGINLFPRDVVDLHEIPRHSIENLEPALKKLYEDFCVVEQGKMYGPADFNNITVGCYFNHSDQPNVRCDVNFNFITIHRINEGEELTVDYATYSRGPPSEHIAGS